MTRPDRLAIAAWPDTAVLTRSEVAAWLQVSQRQVGRLAIPMLDCGERNARYLKGDVVRWLETRRTQGEKAA